MKITFKQDRYNDVELTRYIDVELTLSPGELDTILDCIGEDQIENVSVTIKKPVEADNGEEN